MQSAHPHFCHRCERSFNSEHALDQHLEYSSSHNTCNLCDNLDFEDGDDLQEHIDGCHYECPVCDEVSVPILLVL